MKLKFTQEELSFLVRMCERAKVLGSMNFFDDSKGMDLIKIEALLKKLKQMEIKDARLEEI